MVEEPRAGRLAAWGNALLTGRVSPDDAATGAAGRDARHRVVGLPGEGGPVGLTVAYGRLRAAGAVALRVALPEPGHPLGLCGPPEFNRAALDAGEAVLTPEVGLGLVPEVTEKDSEGDAGGVEVTWHCRAVTRGAWPDVPSVAEAERELALALREATEGLATLGAPVAGPAAEAELAAYRARSERERTLLAPGYPPRAVRVLELAQRVADLMVIARAPEHDGALSAGQRGARDELLVPVARAARRARVAAYNACAEEVERRDAGP